MLRLSLVLSAFISLSAIAGPFEDFGGKEGLVKVVDDTMINLLADPVTKPFFEKADQVRIKEKLVEQFCAELEGPCKYTGQTMARSHKGLDISHAQFFALVESLQKAMDKNNVPNRAQNKLLAKLAPMHKDIINK